MEVTLSRAVVVGCGYAAVAKLSSAMLLAKVDLEEAACIAAVQLLARHTIASWSLLCFAQAQLRARDNLGDDQGKHMLLPAMDGVKQTSRWQELLINGQGKKDGEAVDQEEDGDDSGEDDDDDDDDEDDDPEGDGEDDDAEEGDDGDEDGDDDDDGDEGGDAADDDGKGDDDDDDEGDDDDDGEPEDEDAGQDDEEDEDDDDDDDEEDESPKPKKTKR